MDHLVSIFAFFVFFEVDRTADHTFDIYVARKTSTMSSTIKGTGGDAVAFTLYPPFVSPAFLFARTHFIRRTKKRSSSISEQFVPGQMMDIFQDSLDMVY